MHVKFEFREWRRLSSFAASFFLTFLSHFYSLATLTLIENGYEWLPNYYICVLTKPKVKMAGYRPSSSISVFMDRDDVEVHKNGKKQRGLYPAILPSMRGQKMIYYIAKRFRFIKNQEGAVYFESRERKLCL